MSLRLAIIGSHPVQYYAPWFRHLSSASGLESKVFYLWDFGVQENFDPGFQASFRWDIPLLDGYDHAFVPNQSPRPGTGHFWGLINPSLSREVSQWRPHAVLLFGYAYGALVDFILRWDKKNIPLLMRGDSHRLFPQDTWKSRAKDLLIRPFFRNFSAFLYCGKANYDYFLERGAGPEQLFFVPHALDASRFHPGPKPDAEALALRRQWKLPPGHQAVLFAGKFEEKKRPLDLARAFVRAGIPGTRLIFVGSGPLEPGLKAIAARHPDIQVLPFENQSRMPAVYRAADLFVLPSYGPAETWGLAVQEALSCGTPALVSTHVGCHPDLIRENGAVFEAGSIDALATALRQAFSPGQIEAWRSRIGAGLEPYSYTQATSGLRQALDYVRKR